MCENISNLSDVMLVEKLVVLSTRERELTAEVLLHLMELDKRKLYRDRGYCSLLAYCVQELKYSSSAAKRRLVAVRCIAKYPEVYGMFLRKEVSLTTICTFAPELNEENKAEILSQVAGKSQMEVESLVARLNPTRPRFDRIVPILVQQVVKDLAVVAESVGKNLEFQLGPIGPPLNGRESPGSGGDECYRIEFTASKRFKEKLDLVKSLAARPGDTLEQVLEVVLDNFIDRRSPEKREARRKVRQDKQTVPPQDLVKAKERKVGQSVPQATRDRVFLRDGFRCTFVSDNGVRCLAHTGLHLDHVRPRALGGTHEIENLRVLCGPHNRLVAERVLGKSFMEQFYEAAH